MILSPVVISAAGSLANPIAQGNYRISDSEQVDSPYPLSADYSSTGSTTADAGSTCAADSQNAVTFPAPSDKESAVEDASAFQSLTKSEYASESPAVDSQKDESSSGRTDDGSNPDSHTAADESQTADTNAGRDLSETVTDEDADSAEAADDSSEDQEDVDRETSGTGDTDSESAEASNEEDPEQDNEDENSDVFSTYGSNDFSGTITPEIVRIPADEWAGFGESVDGFLEREKDFFEAGTSIFFDLKGTEYSANIQNDSFDIEKTEDGTAVAIETASIKDGSGVYENVVEYVIRNAGSTSDGEKVDLILTLDEARIELPEESREGASGKIAVSSVSDDHTFRAVARTIPASTDGNDADRENEAEAVDVRASEKWSARIVSHEGNRSSEILQVKHVTGNVWRCCQALQAKHSAARILLFQFHHPVIWKGMDSRVR